MIKQLSRKIERIIENYKILKFSLNNGPVLQINKGISDLLDAAHKGKRPMLTKIAGVDMTGTGEYKDIVALWAGVGDANPIDRIRHLKAQNSKLKEVLRISIDRELTKEEKLEFEMIIRIFE